MDDKDLMKKANEVRLNAYAPYSKFRVGAALSAHDGSVFTGCNVENASFGLSICAERSAFLAAVAAGYRRFYAIAVVSDGLRPPRPCGACLQVMAEFCEDDFIIIMASEHEPEKTEKMALSQLLPERFRLDRT